MPERTQRVLLLMADISGYTEFMLQTRTALEHSLVIMTELLTEIIDQVELPLRVAKIEGDAVFVYALHGELVQARNHSPTLLGTRLLAFFDRFAEKVCELVAARDCPCNACQNIRRLRLKVIVHAGDAGFHQVGPFKEIGGVDVIILHRLLKNSVEGDQYLLITDAARDLCEFSPDVDFTGNEEVYADVGRIGTHVHWRE